jgi:site-specific DNA-methyltransferase (adenine-specific)
MREMKDNEFDLAIVDPPYGINININMGRRKGNKKSDYHKFHGNDKKIPSKVYFDELFRVSKNQIIWGGNYMVQFLYSSPCWVIWDKGFSENVSFAQIELAWTSFSSSAKKFSFNAAANKNRIHPTQKPVALYLWLLQKYAQSGDKILDTHLGSGSSALAAHDLGFDFVGYELDTEYYDKAQERLRQHQRQLSLFEDAVC